MTNEKILYENDEIKIVLQKKYEKPYVIAKGIAGPGPGLCRPNHRPSGRPCNPPRPGGK